MEKLTVKYVSIKRFKDFTVSALFIRYITPLLLSALLLLSLPAAAKKPGSKDNFQNFDDTILETPLKYPDWFKITLGDLREDLKEAVKHGKDGIIVYYGQRRCAYCKKFIDTDLTDPGINRKLRQHYDLIPIDIWGIDTIIDTDGISYSESDLAQHYKTDFTPSLVFYDRSGTPVFRLRGYYTPYQFRAALEYVTEKFYKGETFRSYLQRAVPGMFFTKGGLNERDFFRDPPYNLKKLVADKSRPLVVFFERGDCHTCDLLHTGPLSKENTINEIKKMNAVQLDMWSNTSVITPQGEKTTARAWAKELNIFYAPTLVFFDTNGKEIIRLDSVVEFYRLWGVLDYINRRGYRIEPNYQKWRLEQRKIK